MRFLFLIHDDGEAVAAMTPEERRAIVGEHIAFGSMLRERGAYVLGGALADPSPASRAPPGGPPHVTDGPCAETMEAVGGLYVVECASREEAIELAAGVPQSPGVAVEVLTIVDV